MANVANIRAVITAEDSASAVLKGFGTNVEKTNQKVTESIKGSYLALVSATAGIVAFGKKSLDAFNESDLAVTRLRAGIQNVTSATDKNIDSLLAQSRALQKVTRFSDDQYVSAQGVLSTFQLNQKAIEKLTPRLADMSEGIARINGGLPDLEGNAILVAKAIGGEDIAGLTGALRRVGVIMTKTQEELLQTGNVEERVAIVTKILDQNFQGLAVAAGDTTAGKISVLKNNFNDLQEKVGELIATALTPLLNVLNAHPALLTTVTIAVTALTLAFVGLKAAAAISAVFSGVSASLGVMSAAAATATTALSTLSAVSIAGWAGLIIADLVLVKKALDSVKMASAAVNDAASAAANLAPEAQIRTLQKQATAARAMGDTAKATQIANAIAALSGGRASGGEVYPGSAYMVGESGPEMFVPQGRGKIVPNNQISNSSNINVTFNGIFTGNQQEFRKLAIDVFKAYDDAKGMGTV